MQRPDWRRCHRSKEAQGNTLYSSGRRSIQVIAFSNLSATRNQAGMIGARSENRQVRHASMLNFQVLGALESTDRTCTFYLVSRLSKRNFLQYKQHYHIVKYREEVPRIFVAAALSYDRHNEPSESA